MVGRLVGVGWFVDPFGTCRAKKSRLQNRPSEAAEGAEEVGNVPELRFKQIDTKYILGNSVR